MTDQDLYYKDYFSVNTLYKFSVDPLLELDLNKRVDDILKPFKDFNSVDKEYLTRKVNAAYLDNDIVIKEKVKIEINDLEFDNECVKFERKDEQVKEVEPTLNI